MGNENYKIKKDFIDVDLRREILPWTESLRTEESNPNEHLSKLAKELKGTSYIIDISDNELTNYITDFQSTSKVLKIEVPDFIKKTMKRICEFVGISEDNSFLQVVDMQNGGKIGKHYDASISGYINYKCNFSIICDPYTMYIGEDSVYLDEGDLYCFEASLYKHWTDEFKTRRVLLSFGFMIPYEKLGRSDNDPRIRLSKRIEKYFQNL